MAPRIRTRQVRNRRTRPRDKKKAKDKTKTKPKTPRKLSPFEKAAIDRLKGFDVETADALLKKLPKKTKKKKLIACIDERLKDVKGRRKAIKVTQGLKVAKEPKATQDRARLRKAKKDLEAFRRFYDTKKFPQWYLDLLKKIEKKNKDKKTPAPKQPGGAGNGLIIVPDAVLVGVSLPNGAARV